MAKGISTKKGSTKPKQKPKSQEVIDAENMFSEFLTLNPSTKISTFVGRNGDERLGILGPWSDPSLAFLIPSEDRQKFAEDISKLYLPPRYSAIYHSDIKKLEIIWTAYKLDAGQEEIKGRSFSLRIGSKSYKCEFGQSSEKLLALARGFVTLQISATGFRNMRSFREYCEMANESPDAFSNPVSFWIDNIKWDDDEVLKLLRHVNFYLRYYDSSSPVVEIFPALSEEKHNPQNRYIEGRFPAKIVSRELEAALLVFYSATFTTSSPASNFLNLYRIIEFVSYGYMHDTLRGQIRSVLRRPSVVDDVDRSTTELLMLLREAKLEREQDTIARLLKDVIPVDRLWQEVCQNQAFFSKPTRFEGDLTIDAIASEKSTLETFSPTGVEMFAKAITQIRNALAHGKDSKSAKSILPTSRNFELLRPWVHLISVAAGEVVLYDGAH